MSPYLNSAVFECDIYKLPAMGPYLKLFTYGCSPPSFSFDVAKVAQSAEHIHGKDGVGSSILPLGF